MQRLWKNKDVTLSNPLGEHSWDNGKVTKEATCTKDGEKTYTCTVCNTTKTESFLATGHQHKEVRNAKKQLAPKMATQEILTAPTVIQNWNPEQ